MSKLALAWLWLVFLVVLDFVFPWFVFRHVVKMSGSFLFWVVWALAAIVSSFSIFLKWREVKP